MMRLIAGVVVALVFAGGAAAAAEPPCQPIVLSTGSVARPLYMHCTLQSVGIIPPECVPCPGLSNLSPSSRPEPDAYCKLEYYGGAPQFVVMKSERNAKGKCVPVGAVPLRRASLTGVEARQAPPAQAAPRTSAPSVPVAAPRVAGPRFALPRIMQGGGRPATSSSGAHGGQIIH